MGLQTYIGNNCKQPHLYQLLSSWDTFITCGIEDKCQEENCADICDVTYKDPIKPDISTTGVGTDDFANAPSPTQLTTTTVLPETITPEGDIPVTSTVLVTTKTVEITTDSTTTAETPTPTLTPDSLNYSETTENVWPHGEASEFERKANVEAQLEGKKKTRSATERNMCLVQTVVFGLVLCLF